MLNLFELRDRERVVNDLGLLGHAVKGNRAIERQLEVFGQEVRVEKQDFVLGFDEDGVSSLFPSVRFFF